MEKIQINMIFLSINNIEDLIFTDKKIRGLLPKYKYLFDSFDLSKVSPALRQLGIRCLTDFLKQIKEEDLKIIETYLNQKVEVNQLNLDLVKNIETDINYAELELPEFYNCIDISIYRKKDELKISLWK
jgi:hypothetical protein